MEVCAGLQGDTSTRSSRRSDLQFGGGAHEEVGGIYKYVGGACDALTPPMLYLFIIKLC